MKKILVILALCLATPAMADDVINLPGNATVVPGSNGGQVVLRGYDTDDLIYRRIINPRDRSNGIVNRRIPTNDAAAICGGIERDRKRERCVEDVMKEREKLIRKYND